MSGAKPRKPRQESFTTYIRKVGGKVSDKAGFSADAMKELNVLTYHIFDKIAQEAATVCKNFKRQTIGHKDIIKGAEAVLHEDLSKTIHQPVEDALAEIEKNADKKSRSQSLRAGLIFPIGRVTRMLKKGQFASRIGKHAGLAMAAILEHLMHVICEHVVQVLHKDKKKRIMPRHVQLTLDETPQLATFSPDPAPPALVDLPAEK